MISHRCHKCLWYDQEHESLQTGDISKNYGYCRKHKPIIYLAENRRHYGGWPLVDRNDLCGEFRPDEEG